MPPAPAKGKNSSKGTGAAVARGRQAGGVAAPRASAPPMGNAGAGLGFGPASQQQSQLGFRQPQSRAGAPVDPYARSRSPAPAALAVGFPVPLGAAPSDGLLDSGAAGGGDDAGLGLGDVVDAIQKLSVMQSSLTRFLTALWLPLLVASSSDSSSSSSAAACSTDLDCSLAGSCVAGKCECEAWTKGADCAALNLSPLAGETNDHSPFCSIISTHSFIFL